MPNLRPLFPIFFATLLSACGGGGDEHDPTATKSSIRWGGETLDFGAARVGSTTVRTMDVVNTSGVPANFTSFGNLPAGVTAQGCADIASGAMCSVTFTFRPTTVDSLNGYAVVPGSDPAQALRIQARGLEAGLQALSLVNQQGRTSWTGVLSFKDVYQGSWVLRDFLAAGTLGTNQGTCSITLEGAVPTELAGRSIEIGAWVFRFNASGVVRTSGSTTTTTFTQPFLEHACYTIWTSDPGYSRVIMY